MKIIMSRKGFDTGSGGSPSPVLPDGHMLSLPIPEPLGRLGGATPYDQISAGSYGHMKDVCDALGVKPAAIARGAHLDPDLDPRSRTRHDGWVPALGQAGAASSHLANQNVTAGDLFIFWGLYRQTEELDGKLAWAKGCKPFHAVFGWMVVADILEPGVDVCPSGIADHAHVVAPMRRNNRMYIAATPDDAGTLEYTPAQRLSRPEGPLSQWGLPRALHPGRTGVSLSYHGDTTRWVDHDDSLTLQVVGRGQEFVVEATDSWQEWASSVCPQAFARLSGRH